MPKQMITTQPQMLAQQAVRGRQAPPEGVLQSRIVIRIQCTRISWCRGREPATQRRAGRTTVRREGSRKEITSCARDVPTVASVERGGMSREAVVWRTSMGE